MPAKGQFENLVGRKFTYLKVLELVGIRKWGRRVWRCQCKCGNTIDVIGDSLKQKRTKSCGCFKRQWMRKYKKERLTTHGATGTPEHKVWRDMHKRCRQKSFVGYHNYGGRGIKVCDRWSGRSGFANFLKDMGKKPSSELTIERKRVNGNYEPDNCKWAPMSEQYRNLRKSIYITYCRTRKHIIEWSEQSGIKYATLLYRYNRRYKGLKLFKGWKPNEPA